MSENSIKICPTCGARWVNGQHYWATGAKGNELDLNGLVCSNVSDGRECINPCKGMDGGQTWENRLSQVDAALSEFDL